MAFSYAHVKQTSINNAPDFPHDHRLKYSISIPETTPIFTQYVGIVACLTLSIIMDGGWWISFEGWSCKHRAHLPSACDETTFSKPVKHDDQTTYPRTPAPVLLYPQYYPKSCVSINQKPHHLCCPRSPTLALPHPSYASERLAGSDHGKVR